MEIPQKKEYTFDELYAQAKVLHNSSLKAKFTSAEDILRVMLVGQETGTNPYSALDRLFVDKEGKIVIPGVSAKAILIAEGHLLDFDEDLTDDCATVKVVFKQGGNKKEKVYSYTREDATRAGLWVTEEEAKADTRKRNSYWYKHRKNMMMWRCWYNIVTQLFPHVVLFPIKEAVEDVTVDVSLKEGMAQQTVVSDAVAKKSQSVVDSVVEKMESVEEAAPVQKEEISQEQFEANRRTIVGALNKVAMDKMGVDKLREIVEKYYPDYKELIGGKRITEKKLQEFVLGVRESLLVGATTTKKEAPVAEPVYDVDPTAPELIQQTQKEVQEMLSDSVPPEVTSITIPAMDAELSGRPYRSVMLAQTLYTQILAVMGNEFDEKVDDFLKDGRVNGVEDFSELITYGTEKEILDVVAELS
jgi:hypothetical protein